MLHKLAKFYHLTIFTSEVIQQNVLRVSCLGICWRYKIWISEKLKSNYLKNKKSFWSETKKLFFWFLKCFLLDLQNKLA